MKKLWPVISLGLLLLVMALIFGGVSNLTAQNEGAAIKLQAGEFNPSQGERPDIPPGLSISGYAAGVRGYYIVQFKGPVQQSWKDETAAEGAELLEYIPNFAFKTRMNPAQAYRVAGLDDVSWVGLFQPAYKLSPDIDPEKTNLLRVRLEKGAAGGQARAAIAQSGAQILDRSGQILLVGADAQQLQAIANVLDVAWIENYVLPQKHNEYGAGEILGANTANANGYDGSTQVAAVSDTGLGGGTATTAHADIPASRIVSINNWPGTAVGCFDDISDDGAIDVDSGHGTHTAVSVLGDGGAAGEGKGTAPAANLVFQATENWATIVPFCVQFYGWPADGYFLTGLPDDLRTMYQQAYNDGARIHSNSWGSAQAGVYSVDSANTDDFVWSNPDMAITFSAGNEGTDGNSNGVVDNDSIGSPGTAKNVITVGASENDRQGNYQCDTSLTYTSHDAYQTGETCNSMGDNQINFLGTYGQRYPADFPADPLASDVTAGNDHQMASWSSRGPTDDGRIKPDVVAPGTWILSGFSGEYQEGYGDPLNPQNNVYQWDGWGMPRNEFYKHMGGTSMSNPIVAGAATVVRDYYQKAHTHSASAALVKATLINSAVDLLDENNDGADDNDFPIPNVHEGWGRVELANATDGSHEYVDNATGLSTGGSSSYQFSVDTAGQPFKVTLVYSDYPSTEAAGQNLVNDLDLLVTAPGGAQYKGNVFSGGWSQTGGSTDSVNNVENVFVQSAAVGTWTVNISGFNVPQGSQPFALVVDGSLGTPPPSPTPTDTPPPPTPTDTPEPGATMHVGDLEGSSASAPRNRWEAEVMITVHDESEGPVANATVEGTWSDGASGDASCVTNASGQCSVTKGNLKGNLSSVTFSVSNIISGGYTYNDGANHDLDGDSNGTVIIVYKDGPPAPTATPEPTATPGPSPTPEPTIEVHVGDLDGTSVSAPRNRWEAAVTITVHDKSDDPVANATVEGAWSDGASGDASCVTNASGQCSVTKGNLKGNLSSVTFSVSNIISGGYTYNAGDNHDPDGDSDGTSIVVSRP